MKKYTPICSLLLLLVLIASCQEQDKTDLPGDRMIQAEGSLPESDPYFVDSKATTSSFGPKSITRNILQDREGNMWLATWEGILRYDGTSFTNFTNKDGLRRFRAFSVLEDKEGNIWFGTVGAGVYRYDGKSFTNFTTKDGLAHNGVGCIYEDETGNIWFGTGGGASRYDGQSFRNFTTDFVGYIYEDKKGNIWTSSAADGNAHDWVLSRYDKKSLHHKETPAARITAQENMFFGIVEDADGNIWLGTLNGVYRYDGETFYDFTQGP